MHHTHSLPLKIGLPARSSARIHPTLHTSMAGPFRSAHHQHPVHGSTEPGSPTHIICKAEHDLWRTIPPRRDILCHEALVRSVLGGALAVSCGAVPTRKPKVTNLELTVRIHEQVTRLEIAVEHVRGVDVLEPAERLVDERLKVCVGERLLRADLFRRG